MTEKNIYVNSVRNLLNIKKEHGLTWVELAKKMGISKSALERNVMKNSKPTPGMESRIIAGEKTLSSFYEQKEQEELADSFPYVTFYAYIVANIRKGKLTKAFLSETVLKEKTYTRLHNMLSSAKADLKTLKFLYSKKEVIEGEVAKNKLHSSASRTKPSTPTKIKRIEDLYSAEVGSPTTQKPTVLYDPKKPTAKALDPELYNFETKEEFEDLKSRSVSKVEKNAKIDLYNSLRLNLDRLSTKTEEAAPEPLPPKDEVKDVPCSKFNLINADLTHRILDILEVIAHKL